MELFTLIIAAWGALLSTWLALKDRGRVRVTLESYFLPPDPPGTGWQVLPEFIGTYLVIVGTNHGRRPITIGDAGVRLTDGTDFTEVFLPPKTSFPCKLEEGDTIRLDVQVKNALKDAAFAWLKDTTGKIYKAKRGPLRKIVEEHLWKRAQFAHGRSLEDLRGP